MPDERELLDLCNDLIETERHIRGACFIDGLGEIIAISYRRGTTPLLSANEMQRYITQTAIIALTRQMFESKLGKYGYSLGIYENVIQATIPVLDNNNNAKKLFLSLSFDAAKLNYISIIENSVLPLLQSQILH